jgi:predicted NBD/HSP70 family sugar kinase
MKPRRPRQDGRAPAPKARRSPPLANVKGARAIREANRSLVIAELSLRGSQSRSDLARRLNLTKPTISAVVEELMTDGLVQEGSLVSRETGRPARLIELDKDGAAYAGVHFDADRLSVGIANAHGELVASRTASAKPSATASLISAVHVVQELLRELRIARSRLRGVGVSVPGLVEPTSGRCVLAPSLGWRNVEVSAELANALETSVYIANSTQVAAIAEARVGAARGVRSFVWLHVGNGIGAGIVLNGRIEFGGCGFSGELGHCAVVEGGEPCGCGRRGCLETVATQGALTRNAERAVQDGEATLLANEPEITADAVFRAATAGDTVARRILTKAGEYLGLGVSYLINLLSPERVIIGGDRLAADPFLLESLRSNALRRSVRHENTEILSSSLGESVYVQGGVLLAQTRGTPLTRPVSDLG